MKDWIMLTSRRSGSVFYVQVAHIEYFQPIADGTSGTSIAFVGGDDDYIEVKETPAEIWSLINQNGQPP